MSITIREAILKDASTLTNLIRTSFKNVAKKYHLTLKNCPTHPSNCTLNWIHQDFKKNKTYFILEDPSQAGCVAMEKADDDVCYLERLAVIPQKQKRGYGAMLVKHFIQEARQCGFSKISIAIIHENFELKTWYEKFGFNLTQTKTFEHLPFTVAFMELYI